MGIQTIFAFALLISAAVAVRKGDVSFWRESVTLTCPEDGIFYYAKNNKNAIEKESHEYEYSTGNRDSFYCEYEQNGEPDKKTKYYFYIQGKACPNCFELNTLVFAGVIVADLFGTIIVMVIIYKCTKKRAPGAPKRANNSAARPREPDIPLHYERLNIHTRAEDPYSVIQRTG